MKATELRIGNLVYGYNRRSEVHLPDELPLKILQIELFNCEVLPYNENPATKEYFKITNSDTSGIPLSEKWLLELGVVDYQKGDDPEHLNEYDKSWEAVYEYPNHIIFIRNERNTGFYAAISAALYDESTGLWNISNEIKYVHELQNIIYALTGTELRHTPSVELL